MTVFPRRPIEFNRHCDASSYAGNHTKEKSQPDCISETEYDRAGHRSGEQPQRSVCAAQQIVSQVQRTEHVETRRRDAHAGQQVMIDGVREMHVMIVEGKLLTLQKLLPLQSAFLAFLFFSECFRMFRYKWPAIISPRFAL